MKGGRFGAATGTGLEAGAGAAKNGPRREP